MVKNSTGLSNYYFASTYGEGSFSASTYNGEAGTSTTPGTTTTAPGTPNTGFFQSTFSGASEVSLIPLLLVGAVLIAAIVVGTKKFLRNRKASAASK